MIKTADGQRVGVRPGEVEDRKTSDVSLMPEGLAQTMSVQELVDLLAYLSTLREPVSIVGQYHVLGPAGRARRRAGACRPGGKVDLSATVRGPHGRDLAWRRLDANAEGLVDLTAMAGRHVPGRDLRLHAGDLAGRAEGPARGRDPAA